MLRCISSLILGGGLKIPVEGGFDDATKTTTGLKSSLKMSFLLSSLPLSISD